MKKIVLILFVICSTNALMLSCKEKAKETKPEVETEMSQENAANQADMAMVAEYQCPMDCEKGKTYESQGTCPVCKMELKKVDKEDENTPDEGKHEDHDENHN